MVNVKLHPDSVRGESGVNAVVSLVRTCFSMGGSELQFNTTDGATLRAAIRRPEEYSDLVVRVSGFSARYVGLDRSVQEDILARTEHLLSAPT